ncbi:MAG: hypothetical protein U0990_02565 [Candidatus Nanopelagicales bacterium]|nr:hypothetical protein [Candidatus Nanopelagicales bacterium]MDZ4248954.1 hypothetical protein [Candidatus Nanopelagicales bacterium]
MGWRVVAGTVEQHDEWTEMRSYIGRDILSRARLGIIDGEAAASSIEGWQH